MKLHAIGQKVKIISTPAAYASGVEGILKDIKEEGFVVEIETDIPKPGTVPTVEKKKHQVWADRIIEV